MEELARQCLKKFAKRIPGMINVVRILKAVEGDHCQQTEEERARAEEMVRLQRKIDDGKADSVLARQLKLQLREQNERLTAHREAQRQAQEREDRELRQQDREKEERMELCIVCFDQYDRVSGVKCPENGHFLCVGCFNGEVNEQTSVENMASFKEGGLRIRCRPCGAAQATIDVADVTRLLTSDTFDVYIKAREDALVGEAMQEQEATHQKKVCARFLAQCSLLDHCWDERAWTWI